MDSDEAPGGAGEPGLPPIAPCLMQTPFLPKWDTNKNYLLILDPRFDFQHIQAIVETNFITYSSREKQDLYLNTFSAGIYPERRKAFEVYCV